MPRGADGHGAVHHSRPPTGPAPRSDGQRPRIPPPQPAMHRTDQIAHLTADEGRHAMGVLPVDQCVPDAALVGSAHHHQFQVLDPGRMSNYLERFRHPVRQQARGVAIRRCGWRRQLDVRTLRGKRTQGLQAIGDLPAGDRGGRGRRTPHRPDGPEPGGWRSFPVPEARISVRAPMRSAGCG